MISNNSIGATIYALPEYVSRPTIKTSPKWCPLRSKVGGTVKINGIEQLTGQLDMFGGRSLSERTKMPNGKSCEMGGVFYQEGRND